MAYHVMDEANRCLNCKKPMCMEGCPIHTPIPTVISLLKEGKIDDAIVASQSYALLSGEKSAQLKERRQPRRTGSHLPMDLS